MPVVMRAMMTAIVKPPIKVIKSPLNRAGKNPKNKAIQENPEYPTLLRPTVGFFRLTAVAIGAPPFG